MEKTFPKICIIGAGFSGICMAIKLKTELGIDSFTIYEVCEEVGGTWLVNTYPGCACDLPSHFYSLSFEQNYDWSHVYPPQAEILDYMQKITKKYELYSKIRFKSKVETLRWNENEQKWHTSILDMSRQEVINESFDIIINGTGKIRIPNYPEEYQGFKGPLLHTAKWDNSVSLSGKRVGIIGTGASAVQIIPSIAPEVTSLTVFQRKATYIIQRYQWKYSDFTRWLFRTFPILVWLLRILMFWAYELLFPATRYNSLCNKILTNYANSYRNSKIQNLELRKKLTPSFIFSCKRTVPHESYLETFNRPNVKLITEKISKVSGNIITTEDGEKTELDVLILATGFKQHDFFSPLKIYGRNGIDVLEQWKRDRPQSYLGIVSRSMPNVFTLLGPYTALGHSSNIFTIECQVQWTILAIKELLRRRTKTITVKREAEVKFLENLDKEMRGTVWMKGNCEPWYLDKQGRNTMLWSGTQIKFWRLCRQFKAEKFEFE